MQKQITARALALTLVFTLCAGVLAGAGIAIPQSLPGYIGAAAASPGTTHNIVAPQPFIYNNNTMFAVSFADSEEGGNIITEAAANTRVFTRVSVDWTAMAYPPTGTFTILLSSTKAGYSATYTYSWPGQRWTATGDQYFTMPDMAVNDFVLRGTFSPGTPNTPGWSSSGGSSGGGGGGGGGGAPAAQTGSSGGARSGNVSADGSVDAASVVNEARASAREAGGGGANVTVKNAASVSSDTLRQLANLSRSTGTPITFRADTTLPGGGIEARMYIDPADFVGSGNGSARLFIPATDMQNMQTERLYSLAAVAGNIRLTVRTTGAAVEAAKAQLQGQFGRNAAVIRFEQTGSFGATIKVAVKADLTGLDTNNLKFYAVSSDGTVREIQTTYRIDGNGFLHFSTPRGGTIVVTDRNV